MSTLFLPGAFPDFRSAAAAVLDYLHRRIGFDLWMVTRVAGEEWIILQVEDHGYGVQSGTVFQWADSFCQLMVKGSGPHIAPRTDCIQVYADAPMSRNVKIGSYVGFPLTREDGSVFGTLCAIHPAPQPGQVVSEHPLVALLAQLLSTILAAELKSVQGARREERLAAQQSLDPVTDLYDRAGWQRLLAAEEVRCKLYGNTACVIVADLSAQHARATQQGEQAVEDLLRVAGGCVSAVTRGDDIVARTGPAQFAVLGLECDRAGARALVARMNASLAGEHVEASIAVVHRAPPVSTLEDAWREAERTASQDKPA